MILAIIDGGVSIAEKAAATVAEVAKVVATAPAMAAVEGVAAVAWAATALVAVNLLTELFKAGLKALGVTMKGKLWSILIAGGLAACAAILQDMAVHVPWWQAVLTAMTAGPGSVLVANIRDWYAAQKAVPK